MADKLLYVLAQFDSKSQAKLREIQNELVKRGMIGKQAAHLPYHLTLGSFDPDQQSEISERIEKVCSRTSPIKLTLSHISLFGLGVLFLAPNITHELLNFQSDFIKGSRNDYEWTAHATLLIDNPDAIQKALPIVAAYFKPFCVKIDSICLYEFWPARCIKNHYLE
ncbi:2'-5' RNA ligase family protein [Sporolactobacillus shoreicorticis]|uniref:2'-5' RNA ligase family protein n=1 Tax=Sporolactobacillus shoreicorticis TaxID=1923877 RepID=A0ABW5S5A8_9BACL|nr:2'-5' RNA ligase family protein [Sporolactobacillus shoreicorticis]MCO7124423.1 2'-5' RNA ligase family protein [Sporolactobacillus shoreicorticis]